MNINLQQRHNEEQCLNKDLNIFTDSRFPKPFGYINMFSANVEHVFKANARHL